MCAACVAARRPLVLAHWLSWLAPLSELATRLASVPHLAKRLGAARNARLYVERTGMSGYAV